MCIVPESVCNTQATYDPLQVKTLRTHGHKGVLQKTFLAKVEKEWCLRMLQRVRVDFAGELDRCVQLTCLRRGLG